MINRHVGVNQWASWKQFPWLGMANVTDAWLADSQYLHFTDASHIDIWHPQKGTTDLVVPTVSTQFNASGWAGGSASFLAGIEFRQDSIAGALAGINVPFSLALEMQVATAPTNSMLLWMNEGTSSTKLHKMQFNGTNANFAVTRSDGTTTRAGSTIALALNTPAVFVAVFDGAKLTTRLNGVVKDAAITFDTPLSVGFSHYVLSAGFTTGYFGTSAVAARTKLEGIGKAWSLTEILIIESALRNSAGV